MCLFSFLFFSKPAGAILDLTDLGLEKEVATVAYETGQIVNQVRRTLRRDTHRER